MKYHINPNTGRPNQCTATVRDCKYAVNGELPEHYETKQEAKQAAEKLMNNKHGVTNTLKKGKTSKYSIEEIHDTLKNAEIIDYFNEWIDSRDKMIYVGAKIGESVDIRDMNDYQTIDFEFYANEKTDFTRYDYYLYKDEAQEKEDVLKGLIETTKDNLLYDIMQDKESLEEKPRDSYAKNAIKNNEKILSIIEDFEKDPLRITNIPKDKEIPGQQSLKI